MTNSPPRILYITGWLRSGSTLLGNVLQELPGVLHVGELHFLWRNGVLGSGTNSSCGCGVTLLDCPLWSAALEGVGSVNLAATAHRMVTLQHALLRTRHTRARLAEGRGRVRTAPGVVEALETTARIYRTLSEGEGERLIVDSSKCPAEAAALLGRADIDTRILHIVRDPRATALSFRSAKDYIDPMTPARSSAQWTAFNSASELVGVAAPGRYLRLRHEDLCRRPQETVSEVLRFAGLDDASPVDEVGKVLLRGNHTVTGNPDRLRHGMSRISLDERWRTKLATRDTVVATAAAAPLLKRYGYPVLARGR